ncbi:hypothetical protein MRX96_036452 [Rhipicephalus microplus]
MDVDDAEVGETASNDTREDDSDPTRRDADGDAEGWIEVTYKRKGRVSSGEETAQKGTRSRSPTRRGGKSTVQIQIQVQAGSLGTTPLGVKVQKQTQDQGRAEIHLEGKDARSDNEAASRTEDATQGGLVRRSGQSRFGKVRQ